MKTQLLKIQRGFTVLEMIVVIAVIGLVTSLTTDYMMNEGNQKRFELTQDRIKQIQYALVGDSSRTINGQPALSGYLADTGVMPKYIRDLVSNGYCTDDATQIDRASCEAASAEWRETENWKGPYLQASSYEDIKISEEAFVTIPVFRDGWGNRNADSDYLNFGWAFDPQFENRAVKIASFGLNGELMEDDKNSSEYLYERDLMILVDYNQVKGTELSLKIDNQTTQTNSMFCLKAVYANGDEQLIDLASQTAIPAAKVFGTINVSGMKKAGINTGCEKAQAYSGLKPQEFVSHNQFSSASQIDILIN